MKKVVLYFVLGISLLLLAGCFKSQRVITVKKDGSGMIVETFMLSSDLGKMPGGEETYHDVEKLKSDASKYGEGVSYASSKAVVEGSLKGYEATYDFQDITKLKLLESAADGFMQDDSYEEDDFITFKFKKGKTAELVIIYPEESEEELPEEMEGEEIIYEDEPEPEISDEEKETAMNMAKAMYANMEISTCIVVDGKISETDAVHAEDNKVILEEFVFNEIMEDEKALQKLQQQGDMDDDALEMMKDFPGVKMEIKDKVTIKFK